MDFVEPPQNIHQLALWDGGNCLHAYIQNYCHFSSLNFKHLFSKEIIILVVGEDVARCMPHPT